MYICIYVWIYIYIHMYIRIRIHIHTHTTHTYIYIYIYHDWVRFGWGRCNCPIAADDAKLGTRSAQAESMLLFFSEASFWSGWNCPARCSGDPRPLIAGCSSLQGLGVDVPVTRPVWDSNLGPPASESRSLATVLSGPLRSMVSLYEVLEGNLPGPSTHDRKQWSFRDGKLDKTWSWQTSYANNYCLTQLPPTSNLVRYNSVQCRDLT